MPAKAGIQGGEGVTNTENPDSRFRGKDGSGSPLPVDKFRTPRLLAEGGLLLLIGYRRKVFAIFAG